MQEYSRPEDRPESAGRHCLIFAVDIAGFGDGRRDDAARARMHDTMRQVVSDAFDAGGVLWADRLHEDRGDGMLVIVPGRISVPMLIGPLLARLTAGLRAYNRAADESSRIQLRAAMHVGLVHTHPNGWSGNALIDTFRLLETAPLKRSLAAVGTELAFIASDVVYETVVRAGPMEVDPGDFHRVDVTQTETDARAWIYLAPESVRAAATPRPTPGRLYAPSPAEYAIARREQGEQETRFGSRERRTDSPVGAEPPARLGDVAGPAPAGRPPIRFLSAHLPARVPRRAEVSLVVRVQVDDQGGAGVRTVALRQMAPDGGQVTVVVQAPRGLVPLDALQQVILVPREGDSDPVRFSFRADDIGLQPVHVTAWAGGTFLAELDLEVSVEEHAPYVDTPVRRTPLPSTEPNAGEVTLQVRFDGRHYMFQLLSEAYLFEPVVTESLATEPTAAVERTVALLRQLAEGTAPYTGANARRRLVEAGVGLWTDMVPGEIKDQFWALGEHVSAFSIADDRGIIPWELLYPRAKDRDDGFLVERFPVLRRVYGQQRYDGITLGTPHFIAPAGGPANAGDEIAALRDLLGDDGHDAIGDLAGVLALIDAGPAGALHFACHNAHDPDGGPAIGMDGGPLIPDLLNTAASVRALESRHPLVFLNACRTAGVAMQYLTMTGWAQKFMTAGAGAFVGTLWAVRSESATRFARPFYQALRDGEPLGEASRIARTAARGDDGDPSWLAYTVYGNPTARALT